MCKKCYNTCVGKRNVEIIAAFVSFIVVKMPYYVGSYRAMMYYFRLIAVAGVLFAGVNAIGQVPQGQSTFQEYGGFTVKNEIDRLVMSSLHQRGIRGANRCSDSVFIRRAYLDVIGTLPEPAEVRKFLKNPRSSKRGLLIGSLMKRTEFADYWSLKWCDLLRVKSEFPINLWPNAVQAYHRWIRQSIATNMPYDKFVRELLTTSGSNFRYPQVNFYRAIQGHEPSAIATAVALNFMGVRFEKWPEDKRKDMEAFFSRVAYKSTAEWKEEIVYLDTGASDSLRAVFPDGKTVRIKSGDDPRKVFADWLIDKNNKWFARNIVNRMWAWLLGRGIIHEADDIRDDNRPVHPEVLAYLEKELVENDYDLQHIFKLILNSSTYQQSSIARGDQTKAEAMFACYPVRQLDAEVLADALCKISGTKETYSSLIPEPFTFIPADNRSIELADGSITSPLLEMFGRPSRDTGLESERNSNPTNSQRLHMLNSTHIQTKIERSLKRIQPWQKSKGKPAKSKGKRAKGKVNRPKPADAIYLAVLSRFPTEAEKEAVQEYIKTSGLKPYKALGDVVWALINSKEFLYRH